MIIVALKNGKSLAMRGRSVGPWRQLLLVLRLPVRFRAFEEEDTYEYPANAIAYLQTVEDQTAMDRRAARKAEEDEKRAGQAAARNLPVGTIPSRRH